MSDSQPDGRGDDAPEQGERSTRGQELEGYAFTFCKAAFLAFVLRRYTLLGTSAAAAVLYIAAARAGVREWRCFVKPPWVVLFMSGVAILEVDRLRRKQKP